MSEDKIKALADAVEAVEGRVRAMRVLLKGGKGRNGALVQAMKWLDEDYQALRTAWAAHEDD